MLAYFTPRSLSLCSLLSLLKPHVFPYPAFTSAPLPAMSVQRPEGVRLDAALAGSSVVDEEQAAAVDLSDDYRTMRRPLLEMDRASAAAAAEEAMSAEAQHMGIPNTPRAPRRDLVAFFIFGEA